MKKFIALILVLFIVSLSHQANADTWVNGYTRSDGTYVKGHFRSDPDGYFFNNWSTDGNINPYTGERGYKTFDYSNLSYNIFNYSYDTSYSFSDFSDYGYDDNEYEFDSYFDYGYDDYDLEYEDYNYESGYDDYDYENYESNEYEYEDYNYKPDYEGYEFDDFESYGEDEYPEGSVKADSYYEDDSSFDW